MSLFSPGRWLAVGLALAALMAGYAVWSNHMQAIGYDKAVTEYTIVINKQKAEAVKVLAAETGKAAAATKQLNEFKTDREVQDAKNQNTVAGLERRLVALAGPARRLRDPQATGCGGGGGSAQGANPASAGDRSADPADGTGVLSIDLSNLLLSQAKIADDINIAFASCRADALNLRESLK